MCRSEVQNESWGRQLFDTHFRSIIEELLKYCSYFTKSILQLRVDDRLILSTYPDKKVVAHSPDAEAGAPQDLGVRDSKTDKSYSLDVSGLGKIEILCIKKSTTPGDGTNEAFLETIIDSIRQMLNQGLTNHLLTRSGLHELHLNLTAVSGAADYVMDRTMTSSWHHDQGTLERVQQNIETIHDQLHLATALNRNLIQVYSLNPEADFVKPSFKPVNIAKEIESISDLWQRVSKRRDIDIRCNLHERTYVLGDYLQLRQLFHNLISNAVKYSYAGTERGRSRFVSIESWIHDPGFRKPRISIRISNYGVGILESEVPKLGQPGFRGKLARAEQQMGLGIGVHVAKQIARLHRGEVKYMSKFLHESTRIIDGRDFTTKTHKIECTVILPTVSGRS